MPKRDPYTGEIIKEDEHPVLSHIRNFIQSNVPATRPVGALLSTLMPEGEYKDAMNPYKGKNLPETLLAGGADLANQAGILAMPAEGIAANIAKYAGNALLNTGMGIGANTLAKTVQDNSTIQNVLNTPVGKVADTVLSNYVAPLASIALSGKTALNWLGKSENAGSNAVNFLKNKITKGTAMESMGFDSSGGKLKKTADELSDSIQRGVNASKALSVPVYEQVKPMSVPEKSIKKLLADMEESKSPLTDRGSIALNKDIDNYIAQISKFKNPTVGDIDLAKQSFRNDMKQVKNDFSSTTAESTGNQVSHLMQTTAEDALPDDLKTKFIEAKQNWGTMAEHLQALQSASKADPTTIRNKLKSGEQIDALAHFAEPEVIDKALKTTSHYKHMNDPEKMINDYSTRLQQMDAVNPGIADKVSQIGMGKAVNPVENVNPLTNFLNNKQYEAYTQGNASPWSDLINKANIEGAASKTDTLPLSEIPKYIKPSDMLLAPSGTALEDIETEHNIEKNRGK
jgi:hypothetical protein